MSSPSKPKCRSGHALNRVVPYNGEGWQCDICGSDAPEEKSYHCSLCRYDLCNTCVTLLGLLDKAMEKPKEKKKDSPHTPVPSKPKCPSGHELNRMVPYDGRRWQCDGCRASNPEEKSYHCSLCRYDLCKSCEQGARPRKSTCPSGHALTRMVPQYAGHIWQCDGCRVMFQEEKSYHCPPCRYDLCTSCHSLPVAKPKEKKKHGNEDAKIIHVTAGNFEETVMIRHRPVMLHFHASWCPHSEDFEPIFAGAAKSLKDEVIFGVIDGDANLELCKRFGITGYPTCVIVYGRKEGSRSFKTFKAQRTIANLVAFARENLNKGDADAAPPPKPEKPAAAKPVEVARPKLGNSPALSNLELIKYEDLKKGVQLGQGTFKTVYKGHWKGLPVAIGELNSAPLNALPLKDREVLMEAFQQELDTAAKLRGSQITQILGAVLKPPHLCIVTELMACSLHDALYKPDSKVKFANNLATNVSVALQVTRGIQYMHSLQPPVVHRDLKPANVLVGSNKEVKLADFGLSKALDAGRQLGTVAGTCLYMAPEIYEGKYDRRVDIFSLGVVLFEIFNRVAPAKITFVEGQARIHLDRSLLKVSDKCPVSIKRLIDQMWDKDPLKRPSARQVAEVLQALSG